MDGTPGSDRPRLPPRPDLSSAAHAPPQKLPPRHRRRRALSACVARQDAPPALSAAAAPKALDDVLARALAAAKTRRGDLRRRAHRPPPVGERSSRARTTSSRWTTRRATASASASSPTGRWGFAAAARVEGAAAEDAATRATLRCEGERARKRLPVRARPDPGRHRHVALAAVERDPFSVPIEEKAAFLLSLWSDAKGVAGVKYAESWVRSLARVEGLRVERGVADRAIDHADRRPASARPRWTRGIGRIRGRDRRGRAAAGGVGIRRSPRR